ncbi:MAG: hypothetical protein MUF54_10420 [Polyangiaceae bacterium]|jgi:hypothetical protein|nr:hypothetical protein [Polyangiaceae bacterium]
MMRNGLMDQGERGTPRGRPVFHMKEVVDGNALAWPSHRRFRATQMEAASRAMIDCESSRPEDRNG